MEATLKPVPGKIVLVSSIPQCNFCPEPGPYDFRTIHGSAWANGCETHWREHRAYPELGLGKGQLWITETVPC